MKQKIQIDLTGNKSDVEAEENKAFLAADGVFCAGKIVEKG